MDSYLMQPLRAPITGDVVIPGSKSFTNRALVMASLAEGRSVLDGISESVDSYKLVDALAQLGIACHQDKDIVVVDGNSGWFSPRDCYINVDAAGTAMRFLTALCACVPGRIVLDGNERMRRDRPIKDLTDAVVQLGAPIQTTLYGDSWGHPPLTISGGLISGRNVRISGKKSSQFITALLLVAPLLPNGLDITVEGKQVSPSYIDMTIAGMKDFGVVVENDGYQTYHVAPGQHYRATNYHIEGDASGASYLWSLAALTGSCVRVRNIHPSSCQGDATFPDILGEMGCIVRKNSAEQWIEVQGQWPLRAVNVDMNSRPDTAQTLAVVAAFAQGKTTITGLSTLPDKESKRIEDMVEEFAKIGIQAQGDTDQLVVEGGNPHGAVIEVHNDHRMAMSFAIAGTRVPGVVIQDPLVVGKSFPEFWDMLKRLGVRFAE